MATIAGTERDSNTRTSALAAGSGLRQILIFVAAYLVYFGVRALTEGSTRDALANALSLIRFERDQGLAWEGALQEAMVAFRTLRPGVALRSAWRLARA